VGAEPREVIVVVVVVIEVKELIVSVLVGELLGVGVYEGGEDEDPFTTQEQADETRDGIP
jgi:hypothetical protein